jgi:hypothetical protein
LWDLSDALWDLSDALITLKAIWARAIPEDVKSSSIGISFAAKGTAFSIANSQEALRLPKQVIQTSKHGEQSAEFSHPYCHGDIWLLFFWMVLTKDAIFTCNALFSSTSEIPSRRPEFPSRTIHGKSLLKKLKIEQTPLRATVSSWFPVGTVINFAMAMANLLFAMEATGRPIDFDEAVRYWTTEDVHQSHFKIYITKRIKFQSTTVLVNGT